MVQKWKDNLRELREQVSWPEYLFWWAARIFMLMYIIQTFKGDHEWIDYLLPVVVGLVAVLVVMGLVSASVGLVALDVDAAVEIAVGLVQHREANRLARVGKSDGQRAAPLRDLWKTADGNQRKRGDGEPQNRRWQRPDSRDLHHAPHSPFLFLSASAAKPSRMAT